jgi:hypothetical protein
MNRNTDFLFQKASILAHRTDEILHKAEEYFFVSSVVKKYNGKAKTTLWASLPFFVPLTININIFSLHFQSIFTVTPYLSLIQRQAAIALNLFPFLYHLKTFEIAILRAFNLSAEL